jgi:uncharacterized protein (DUF1499 family)
MKWVIFVCLVPLLLAGGALVLNRAPLWGPPGPMARLQLYLTTHVAETRLGHERPELQPLFLELPLAQVRDEVVKAMRQLGWQQIAAEPQTVRAVVVTSLLRFKDDVEVALESTRGGVLVNVRSRSRVGQGDFAANTRHVLELYRMLSPHSAE